MIVSRDLEFNKIIEKYLISLAVLLYILRTAIPFLKFPFLVLFSILLIYFLVIYRNTLGNSVLQFLKTYYLILILAAQLLLAFLLSYKLYLLVFKDLVNALILILIGFILFITTKDRDDLKTITNALINTLIVFGILISIVRIVDLLNIFSSSEKTTVYQVPYTIEIGSLPIDYNFAILPVFLSMISIYFLMTEKITWQRNILFNAILILSSISIIFSGSRRGLIVLFLLVLISILSHLSFINRHNYKIKQISINTRIFVIGLFMFVTCCLFVVYNTSYVYKNRLIENLGSKNLVGTKGEIANAIARYTSVFNKNADYESVYNIIWTPGFDPRDPDSGWGSRMHKSVYPLSGENVSIVPEDSKGYYMDYTSNADTLNGNAYSASWIFNHEFNENMILDASVYCFVSDSCQASVVMICSLGAMGNPGALYDLEKKGIWQKLNFIVDGRNGGAGILLFFSQNSVKDFSKLGGYIIYAYPEIRIIDKRDGTIIKSTSLAPVQSADPIVLSKNKYSLFYNKDSSAYKSARKKIYHSEFGTGFLSLHRFLTNIDSIDQDPIRRFTSKLISEDTTYRNPESLLDVGSTSFDLILGRTLRWQFAWQIYTNEYNFWEKIFGGGFRFLNWYGNYFLKDKTKSDYPHNPFLSVLLYSGLFGLFFYLVFLGKLFKIILKHYYQHPLISLFFFITFFFSFFSSGSPFDPPIMGFFSILIFHIYHVINKTCPDE